MVSPDGQEAGAKSTREGRLEAWKGILSKARTAFALAIHENKPRAAADALLDELMVGFIAAAERADALERRLKALERAPKPRHRVKALSRIES